MRRPSNTAPLLHLSLDSLYSPPPLPLSYPSTPSLHPETLGKVSALAGRDSEGGREREREKEGEEQREGEKEGGREREREKEGEEERGGVRERKSIGEREGKRGEEREAGKNV